jgi:hypothetical protein
VSDYLCCNSAKSYLSPVSNLPKGNGAPHANSIKLGRNRMCFAEKAQLTFRDVAKGKLFVTFWNLLKKAIK